MSLSLNTGSGTFVLPTDVSDTEKPLTENDLRIYKTTAGTLLWKNDIGEPRRPTQWMIACTDPTFRTLISHNRARRDRGDGTYSEAQRSKLEAHAILELLETALPHRYMTVDDYVLSTKGENPLSNFLTSCLLVYLEGDLSKGKEARASAEYVVKAYGSTHDGLIALKHQCEQIQLRGSCRIPSFCGMTDWSVEGILRQRQLRDNDGLFLAIAVSDNSADGGIVFALRSMIPALRGTDSD